MSIRFVHTADVHIGMRFENASFEGSVSKKRRREIMDSFLHIVEYTEEIKADLLLIAGDLFEERYAATGELKEITSALSRLEDTKVVIIAGNHDPMTAGSRYSLLRFPENAHIVENKMEKLSFEDIGVDIYASSWPEQYITENLLDEISIEDASKTNILLCHADVYSKSSQYLPMDIKKALGKGFAYIALGHFHKPDMISDTAAYPGSPEPLDFGETGEHGFIQGSIAEGETSIRFIPCAKRGFRIIEVQLDETMTAGDIISEIRKNQNDKDMMRFILKGIYSHDVELELENMKTLLKDDFFHIEILNRAEEDLDIERVYEENKGSIIGEYIKKMREQDLEDEMMFEAFSRGLRELMRDREG